ncbi:acyl-CoA thioesterase [Parasphingorhabdus sp.]|uniref:acyl-CoA thioesterase n=1 Tax=Parasphingorhabdus sp. TaxID=2709688 RepID=UPI003002EEAC
MTALSLKDYPYHFEVITRRSDSVGNGHIPNAQLATYFDDAREQLNSAVMMSDPYEDTSALSLVLAEIGMRFASGINYPGALTIGVGISRVGRSSFDVVAGFFRDGQCLTTAWCTMVKLVNRRASALTSAERERAFSYSVAT